MAIVKRITKGSALTHAELDNNFTELEAGAIGPVAAFASLPAAADNAGKTYRVSDVGRPGIGSLFMSDGVRWQPLNGRTTLLHCTIPFIQPSGGSFGNNGALTLTVALDRVYARCFMYFPAGAIHGASLAGWYWTIMSSTTVGVVYNNTYTSGYPAGPAVVSGFTVTGPGAYTATTNADTPGPTITLPGNALGIQGSLVSRLTITAANSANTKTAQVLVGGSLMQRTTCIGAGNIFANAVGGLAMDGASNTLKSTHTEQASGFSNGTAYTQVILTNDMTVDKAISATLKLPTSSTVDWLALQEFDLVLIGG